MDACPICDRGEPLDVIAELAATWATAAAEAPLPGYVCVVSKRHVVEPFELPPAELAAFWRESMLIARAVAGLLQPAKMNYEIHGNTIPHLHMHLYPRLPGDPGIGAASFSRSRDEIDRRAAAIAAAR